MTPRHPQQRERAVEFVAEHEAQVGRSLLSDEVRSRWQRDLAHCWLAGDADGQDTASIDGVAIASRTTSSWLVESVATTPEVHHRLLTTVVAAAAERQVDTIRWWQYGDLGEPAAVAEALAFTPERTLLQMRRPLPIGSDEPDIAVRSLRVGTDDDAWVETNRLAFAWHPEQGLWSIDDLHARMDEPWFEAEGFLVWDAPDVDGALAGFCWTKRHLDTSPLVGEIYVVAVHPERSGRGAGRALTAAGLRSLCARGATIGMLHVDETNVAAVHMYERMGFTRHHADRSFIRRITSSPGAA
jgi:mycothiol synthase